MRLPAQRSIEQQAAFPSQAEGGFSGDLHASLHAALCAWEKRRNPNAHFRYGRGGTGVFRREKTATATRTEISWNEAPQVKKAPKVRPRKKKPTSAELTAKRKEYVARYRAKMTPEHREKMLAKKRAAYLAKVGGKLKNKKLTPEERQARKNEINRLYRQRVRAGLQPKAPSDTPEKRREYKQRHGNKRNQIK